MAFSCNDFDLAFTAVLDEFRIRNRRRLRVLRFESHLRCHRRHCGFSPIFVVLSRIRILLAISTSEAQSVDEDIKQDSEFPRYLFPPIPVCSWKYQAGLRNLVLTKIKYKQHFIKVKIY